MVCRDVPSAPYSLPPHAPFPPILRSAPGILRSAPYSRPPQPPVRPRLPSAPCSFRPMLPSAPASLPPQPPVRPMLPSAPSSLPPVDVRGCLSADAECDGAALASCSALMCECAARMCGGSQAHPLPSCAPMAARLAVHARSHWHSTTGPEQELWLTHLWHDVCATKPARHAPTRSSSMRSDAISRPYGDFTPAAVWVEGHLGAARFLCMTCIEWVVEPAAAMT